MGIPIIIKNNHPIIIPSESSAEIKKEKTQNNSSTVKYRKPKILPKILTGTGRPRKDGLLVTGCTK